MRVIYLLLSFMLCFYPVTQAQNTTNQFMTQAQSSLEKKDYTKARYLFLQAYKSLSQKGDYTGKKEVCSILYNKESDNRTYLRLSPSSINKPSFS